MKQRMTFFEHLLELRSKLIIALATVAVCATVAHAYHEALIAFLLQPVKGKTLFFLSPLEPFFFILRIDLYAGTVLALPVLNWCVFSFVKPAMKQSSWWLFSVAYGSAAIFILSGLAYAYFVMVPISLGYLLSIHVTGIDNMITADSYMSFLLGQSLIVAIIFQIPLFIVGGTYIRAFNIDTLSSRRRSVYVAGLILLAILSPGKDALNLSIVAVPALLLFEGSLLAGRIVQRAGRRSL